MIRIKLVQGVVVLSPSGHFTEEDLVRVKNLLSERIERNHRRFIVNLSGTRWMPVSAIGVLLEGIRRLRKVDGDLRIAGLKGSLKKFFDVFHLSGAFGIYPNERQALKSFGLRKEAA